MHFREFHQMGAGLSRRRSDVPKLLDGIADGHGAVFEAFYGLLRFPVFHFNDAPIFALR